MAPVFKNIGERFTAKNYHTVNLLSVVSKVFEKIQNKRTFDYLEKWEMSLWISQSTADLLAVVPDRSAGDSDSCI